MRPRCPIILASVALAWLCGCGGLSSRSADSAHPAPNGSSAAADAPPSSAKTAELASTDERHVIPPGSTRLDPPPAGSVLPTVLMINNDSVTVDDILEPIRPQLEKTATSASRDGYYELLFQLIRRQIIEEVSERLIWQEASRELSSDDQKKRLDVAVDRLERDRINAEFGGRETRYEKYLASLGKSRADVRERLKRRIVVEQYLHDRLVPRVSVRKRDLMKYYDEHPEDWTEKRTVEMWMIEAPLPEFYKGLGPPSPDERRKARDDALAHITAAQAKLRAGTPFDQVARSDSRGLHREDGGNWGVITAPLRGNYEKPSRVALALPEGATSDIIETPMALFIVKAAKVTGGETRRFEEVQGEIANRLQTEQFNELKYKFIQRTLEKAAVGDLEPFVRAVVARAPESSSVSRIASPELLQ